MKKFQLSVFLGVSVTLSYKKFTFDKYKNSWGKSDDFFWYQVTTVVQSSQLGTESLKNLAWAIISKIKQTTVLYTYFIKWWRVSLKYFSQLCLWNTFNFTHASPYAIFILLVFMPCVHQEIHVFFIQLINKILFIYIQITKVPPLAPSRVWTSLLES